LKVDTMNALSIPSGASEAGIGGHGSLGNRLACGEIRPQARSGRRGETHDLTNR
jgi:hypothetical protein